MDQLVAALAQLPLDTVRLVVDGLDQLEEAFAHEVRAPLVAMATNDRLGHVRVIASLRDPGEADWLPEGAGNLAVTPPKPQLLARYLARRKLRPDVAEHLAEVCSRGDSAWLLARLLADTHDRLDPDTQLRIVRDLATGTRRERLLTELFDHDLDAITAEHPETGNWDHRLRPLLTTLAAAGHGPVMPLQFLHAVAVRFGGPEDPQQLRDTLDALDRFVIRIHRDTDRELLGLFHPALADHLARHTRREVDVTNAHRILLDEIDRITPVTGIYLDNPLYRWAADAAAEHWLALGDGQRALHSLQYRRMPTPAQEVQRWERWPNRFRQALGSDHPDTLTARQHLAYWRGKAGDPASAAAAFEQLLPDQLRFWDTTTPTPWLPASTSPAGGAERPKTEARLGRNSGDDLGIHASQYHSRPIQPNPLTCTFT
jgi:hypothetical protein